MTRLRTCPGVAVIEDVDAVYVASLPDGPIVVLEGIAAVIWAAARGEDRAAVAERVAEATTADIEEVRSHVDGFVDDLIARGLIEIDRG